MPDYQDIIDFWFKVTPPAQWYKKDAEFDQLLRKKFLNTHQQATACELFSWRDTAKGRLAEIIVLDQFSRNMFRDTPAAFASDQLALALAQEALRTESAAKLSPAEQSFLLVPFMHSESRVIQKRSVELYTKFELKGNLDYAVKHKAIVDRFGRYPHRNTILGRQSSPEELEFLQGPGSSF